MNTYLPKVAGDFNAGGGTEQELEAGLTASLTAMNAPRH